jgi:hypothetical protein
MRLAGATRAQARGVTDGRIGSDGWCVPDMRVTYEVEVLDARIQN